MSFVMRVHRNPEHTILAVCDEEILGMTFRGDGLKIEVRQEFYGEDTVTEEEVKRALNNKFTTVNIVGNKAVDLAIELGIIDPENVIIIGEVKHAQAVII